MTRLQAAEALLRHWQAAAEANPNAGDVAPGVASHGRPPQWRLRRWRSACRELRRLGLPEQAWRDGTPPQLLKPAGLQSALPQFDVEWHFHCRSTQAGWRRHAGSAARLVIAESQAGGRGRHGRRWQSALTGNLYFTCVQPLPAGTELQLLPLLAGLSLAESLRELGIDARLKWPNDVLVDGCKLAGILTEIDTQRQPWRVAFGIGLNWLLPAAERRRIDRPATDLLSCAGLRQPPRRQQVLLHLVTRLHGALLALPQIDRAELLARWRQLDALRGCRVRVQRDDDVLEGEAGSIDDAGRLLLHDGRQWHRLLSGEVQRVQAAP